jgi:hypothetical protein
MITTHTFSGGKEIRRHLGRLTITGEALIFLLTKGIHIYEIIENELPYDTEFVSFTLNKKQNLITLVLSHPSFPEVLEGGIIMELTSPNIKYGDGVLLDHLKENWFKFTMAQAIEEETNK